MQSAYTVGHDWNPARRYVTTTQAAQTIGRPTSTIRRWIAEGRLAPVVIVNGTRYYREADVLAADAQAHRHRRGA